MFAARSPLAVRARWYRLGAMSPPPPSDPSTGPTAPTGPSTGPSTDPAVAPWPTRLVLPDDSCIPSIATPADHPGGRGIDDDPAWLQPYVSALVHVTDERERRAWFHFCHGHHLEFLYWQATLTACDRAAAAATTGDDAALAAWMARVDALVRGSGAMLSFCGAFDPEVYDPLLRTSMAAQRDDFSGDMSADFLRMMHAKNRLKQALAGGGARCAEPLAAFGAAEQYWYHHHSEVVLTLHPGDSLLKIKIDDLKARSADFDYQRYIDTVVRGEQATRDYDEYFGVTRSGTITLERYWTQALAKIDVVHHHFALEPRVRALLLRADAVLLTMVSEQLAATAVE